MSTTFVLDLDLLKQAQAVGGQLDPEFDRQTQTSEKFPFYSVVGSNSKDANYRGTLDGKSVVISRAGDFRRKNEEGLPDYFSELPEMVIIDARTANTLFEDNQPACRGLSTQGFYKAVCTTGKMGSGFSCEACPYNRFRWKSMGGEEGQVRSPEGKVITKTDLCNSALQLWCWDLSRDEYCVVQFSAGALKHYREFVRGLETQGVKMHSLLWRITTTAVENGQSAAPSFVPQLEPVRVLTEEEFRRADEKRAELVVKALALSEPKQEVLAASEKKALPQASAFTQVPKELETDAEGNIVEDPFVLDN